MLAAFRLLMALLLAALCFSAIAAAKPPPIDRSLGPPFTQRARATLGPVDTRLVMIEVSDFRCEHCRLFHERVFPRIKERYIDSGLIRYVVLPAVADGAAPAPALFGMAKLALERGRYWTARRALFAHAYESDPAVLARVAGLDPVEAAAYVASTETRAAVADDQAEATNLKVLGTPTFFLRQRLEDGNFAEARVDGYESWDYFESLIADLLRPQP